jgi:hypothetical protein
VVPKIVTLFGKGDKIMRQFEYKVLHFSCALHAVLTGHTEGNWEKELNDLGSEGWEVISAISPPMAILGMATFVRFILKRPHNSLYNSLSNRGE